MKKLLLSLILLLPLLPLQPALSGPLKVFVSIVPQEYFVRRIGNNLVDVAVMVKPGDSPAVYEPKPEQMKALAGAAAYFSIGVPFENVWLKRIAVANPGMMIVATDKGVVKRTMETHAHSEPDPGKPGQGSAPPEHNVIKDPHIWLSPPLVKIQGQNILAALQKLDPAHADVYRSNYEKFALRLDNLHRELTALFAGLSGPARFMIFHPSWGYFADTYGLEQIPIEIEGKEPKPRELERLTRLAREHDIKVVFVQPQFSTKSASAMAAAIGGRVVYADPLAANWEENIISAARTFKAALK